MTEPGTKRQSLGWALVIALLLVASLLRFTSMTLNSLWFDELHTVMLAKSPLREFLRLTARDMHPPLFPLFAFSWVKAFGSSEIAIRSLPAIIGVLTVLGSFLAYRRLFGTGKAIGISVLISTLPLHVYYSQEFRNYSLVFAGAMLVTAALRRFVETPSRRTR